MRNARCSPSCIQNAARRMARRSPHQKHFRKGGERAHQQDWRLANGQPPDRYPPYPQQFDLHRGRGSGDNRRSQEHRAQLAQERPLSAIDGRLPTLIKGATFKGFLDARRAKRKRPCGPGRLYCLKCRAPKIPAYGEVEFEADTPKLGWLIGLCPDCGNLIRRRTSRLKLRDAAGNLIVRFRCETERLDET